MRPYEQRCPYDGFCASNNEHLSVSARLQTRHARLLEAINPNGREAA